MNALVLNGTRADDAGIEPVFDVLIEELTKAGFEPEPVLARELDVAPCRGCFACWEQNPGECLTDDDSRRIAAKLIATDLLILFTPVAFGGYASPLKMLLDRMLPLISPFFTEVDGETHHVPRYEHYPPLMCVGVHPHPDEETRSVFSTLAERNAINMYSPHHWAGIVSPDDEKLASYLRQMIRFTREDA